MLLLGSEPAFSGKILKKLDKELKKVNDPFFLSVCIVIKSFSYIQMKYQIFDQDFFADIGKNIVDIKSNADEIYINTVCSYHSLILFLCSKSNFFKYFLVENNTIIINMKSYILLFQNRPLLVPILWKLVTTPMRLIATQYVVIMY